MIGELDQRLRRDDFDFGRGPRRFRSAELWTDQTLSARIGADGRGQHTRDRRNRTVEAEFAEHGEA